MCEYQHCRTPSKDYGYCVECGEEICDDCADESKERHSGCNPKIKTSETGGSENNKNVSASPGNKTVIPKYGADAVSDDDKVIMANDRQVPIKHELRYK